MEHLNKLNQSINQWCPTFFYQFTLILLQIIMGYFNISGLLACIIVNWLNMCTYFVLHIICLIICMPIPGIF